MEYLQTILFFKAFNSLILVMYWLQFHRFFSERFASNFVSFLNERDGLSKWAPTKYYSTCKRRCLYINFDNGVNFCGNYFFAGTFFADREKTAKIPKIWIRKKLVPHCMSARAMFLAAAWLPTQDLHKSNNGMIFSNKARLLLDFSRVFQNVSPCEIMWKIKQSLLIYLSGYGSCHVRQAWCHAGRRRTWLSRSAILFWFKQYRINFCDKLRFLLDPKYLPMEE